MLERDGAHSSSGGQRLRSDTGRLECADQVDPMHVSWVVVIGMGLKQAEVNQPVELHAADPSVRDQFITGHSRMSFPPRRSISG
jgi:hypothetical protein